MRYQRAVFITVIAVGALAAAAPVAAKDLSCPSEERGGRAAARLIGYYASWDAYGGLKPDQIKADVITHINYAFAGISADGLAVLADPCVDAGECGTATATQAGNFARLASLKKRNPAMKILVSIGGWKGSVHFSDVAATAEARQRFVRSAIQLFLDRWPGLVDGFDLDWESPVEGGASENRYRPDDKRNYTLLAAEFRRQLDERSSGTQNRHLLTIAGPAGAEQMANIELADMMKIADWINVMTYDYHVGGKLAHFNAPLFPVADDPTPHLTIDWTVKAYLQAGVPPEKIVLGLPFYGYGRGGVSPVRNGFLQPSDEASPEFQPHSTEKTWGLGAMRYSELRAADARGFRRFWQAEARVPWLYNPETQVWISYDDSQSLAEKVDYATRNCLSGVMIWNLGGDDGSLLEVIHRQLRRR